MKNKQSILTKDDIKFIITLMCLVIPLFIWAIRLESRVRANQREGELLKEKISEYPSADWFEEKFRNTDEKIEIKFENILKKIEDLEKKT